MQITAAILLPAFVVALGVVLVRWFRGKMIAGQVLAALLFQVLNYTLFPVRLGVSLGQVDPWSYISLVPFDLSPDFGGLAWQQAAKNSLLFVPFGFAFPFIFRGRLRWTLLTGAAASLLIELTQLALNELSLAIPLRVIDVNDFLFNVLGVAGGLALFRMSSRVYGAVRGAERLNTGIWRHFHQTLIGAYTRGRGSQL